MKAVLRFGYVIRSPPCHICTGQGLTDQGLALSHPSQHGCGQSDSPCGSQAQVDSPFDMPSRSGRWTTWAGALRFWGPTSNKETNEKLPWPWGPGAKGPQGHQGPQGPQGPQGLARAPRAPRACRLGAHRPGANWAHRSPFCFGPNFHFCFSYFCCPPIFN